MWATSGLPTGVQNMRVVLKFARVTMNGALSVMKIGTLTMPEPSAET